LRPLRTFDVISANEDTLIENLIAGLGVDRPVQQVLVGAYWTAVQTGYLDLVSTQRDPGPGHLAYPVEDAGRLRENTALPL